jgi:hypothetical protein
MQLQLKDAQAHLQNSIQKSLQQQEQERQTAITNMKSNW